MFDRQSGAGDRSPVGASTQPTPPDDVPATSEDIARWEAECGYPRFRPPVHLTDQVTELMNVMPPGVELAALLDQAELTTADDAALVEVVAAWHRLGSWVAAQAARTAATLSERESMNPDWPAAARGVTCMDTTGEELAMRLGCSRRQARLLVRDGRAFAGHLGPTGEALADGHIDPVKARLLVDALRDLPVEVALDVQESVLPGADRRTPTQLSRETERQVIAADPTGAQDRHEAARACRRVNAPRPLPNGMAGLWAMLPAAGAVQLDTTLDALARTARSGGDPRTLDQLRADLLVDLTVGTATGATRADGVRVADADVAATTNTTDASRPTRHQPRRARIQVVAELTTLAGLDEHPAELVGYGPVTADTARILARGGTWQRILTDPLSGTVLDVGRTRYRPPADMAEHVSTRDRTCSRPGCSTPAERCDLDHTTDRPPLHRDPRSKRPVPAPTPR